MSSPTPEQSLPDLPASEAIAMHHVQTRPRPFCTVRSPRTPSQTPSKLPSADGPSEFESEQGSSSAPHLANAPNRSPSIDVTHFDPTGVQQLHRKLTQPPGTSLPSEGMRRQTDKSEISLIPREGPINLERTLKEILRRRDEADIKGRELGVVFENLDVIGRGNTVSYQNTLGSVLNPLNLVRTLVRLRHPPLHDIISDFNGVVRPGEMLLVLGRPGAGCSTFLKVLANQRREFHSVKGEVHYDAFSPAEIDKHYRGDVQYCPEDDIHFPTLTVGQTLRFAVKMRAPQKRFSTRGEYTDTITEIVMTIFGLTHVQNTPVGDAAIRGVSGGEKKRVSIAEALATRSRLGSWDNSTRGLDSSTALEFVQALRIASQITRSTMIVSIYQASESLFELFDKVCLIYEGRMTYFGPADKARQYFIDMGYKPANRQTTPDFLVAVTDPHGRTAQPGKTSIPRTATEFADHYKNSPIAKANADDIQAYKAEKVGSMTRAHEYKESAAEEHAKTVRRKSPYTVSIPMQARAVMLRRVQILLGNKFSTLFSLALFIVQGVIVGTVFVKLPVATEAYFSRGGVLFFALLFSALSSMAEIPALFAQRPIVRKHKNAAMYHPFVEAIALTVVDLPITFVSTILFGILIYFITQLQQTPAQFFTFYLILYLMAVTMRAWFRAIAAAFRAPAPAQAFSGLALFVLVIYTGYMIPTPSMIGALRWLNWINPMRYGFEALIANEFHTIDGTCSSLVPSGPGYENIGIQNQVCTTIGSLPGEDRVNGNRYLQLSFNYSYSHEWRNVGIVIAWMIGLTIALLVFTEFNTASEGDVHVVLFKRGSKSVVLDQASERSSDEEKLVTSSGTTSTAASSSTSSSSGKQKEKLTNASQPRASGQSTSSGGEVDAAPKEFEKGGQEAIKSAAQMKDIFSWEHIQYVVPVHGGERKLLDDVSGFVVPGKLTALMGESGAGKTTLLNVLAERVHTGVVRGDRYINGHALPPDFRSQTGYCQQMDTHVPTDTVREALLFSAKLRQPSTVSLSEKKKYVETCLKMCGLEPYGDAIVGSLNIELRKRTTIAVELAAKPRLLLFLDEPTSGLDSQSAWSIVDFLRSLADAGQAILCTIHQPSAVLFQAFDRLLLLQKGGQTAFFGDLGHNASRLISYFERYGARQCKPMENPAEYMLDVIGAGATATSEQNWHQVWLSTPECQEAQREVEEIRLKDQQAPPVKAEIHSTFAAPWWFQFTELWKRDTIAHWRNPTYTISKLILNIFSGLFIGFTFFKAENTEQGVQNKLFGIYMSTILAAPLANQLQGPFIDMRNIYQIRERPSRIYSWTALITSQFLAELPWNLFGSSIYFLCWYWTVAFDTSRAGFTYFMLAVIFPFFYTSLAQGVAAMSPNAEMAALLYSFLFSFITIFNGVLQPFRQLGWWKWMYRVSPFTYIIEALLGQAIGHEPITCSSVELVTLTPPAGQTCGGYLATFVNNAGGTVINPDATSSCQFCTFATTDEFLQTNFNIFYSHHWRNLGLVCVYIIFNICAMYAFTYWFQIRTSSVLGSLRARFFPNKQSDESD